MSLLNETELCIVCNERCLENAVFRTTSNPEERKSTRLKVKRWKEEGSISFDHDEEAEEPCLALLADLRAMFVVQHVFRFRSGQGMIETLLVKIGSPAHWYRICDDCLDVIDQGIDLISKMKLYERKHKKIVSMLNNKFVASESKHSSQLNERLFHPDTTENAKLRMNFRDHLRFGIPVPTDLVKEEKLEPTFIDDEFMDDDWKSSLMDANYDGDDLATNLPQLNDRKETLLSLDSISESLTTLKPTIQRTKNKPKKLKVSRKVIDDWTPYYYYSRLRLKRHRKKLMDAALKQKPPKKLKPVVKPKPQWIQYLDLTMFNYSPVNDEDHAKIPKETVLYTAHRETGEAEDGNYPCLSCEKCFDTECFAVAHIQFAHFGIKQPWSCDQCNCRFTRLPGLQIHLKKHKIRGLKVASRITRSKGLQSRQPGIDEEDHAAQSERDPETTKPIFADDGSDMELDCSESLGRPRNLTFYARWMQFLDLTLFPYPFESPEDKEKVPKETQKIYKKEEGTSDNGRFDCPACPKRFTAKYFAIAHIQRVHFHMKPWKCTKCSTACYESNALRRHFKIHGKGSTNLCPICGKRFRFKTEHMVNVHIVNHQKESANPTCDQCNKRFETFKKYVQHMEKQHGIAYFKRETCDLCGCKLPTRNLDFHKYSIHQVGNNDSGKFPICDECGQCFMNERMLRAHIKKIHAEVEKNVCHECGQECVGKDGLKRHMESKHIENTTTTCRFCGLEQATGRALRTHLTKYHAETLSMSVEEEGEYLKEKTSVKPFTCNLCSQKYSFRVQLYHHYHNDHAEVTEKYKCSECGKGFSRQSSVKRHFDTVHSPSMHPCACGKVYKSQEMLKVHTKSHCVLTKQLLNKPRLLVPQDQPDSQPCSDDMLDRQ